jgi:dipeptidyl aminopeptidase/acylaminoacyl peptidase
MKVVLAALVALGFASAGLGQSAPSIEDFAAMPNLHQPRLSPDGERIALIAGESRATRVVMVISLVGDPATVIDAGDDQILDSAEWVSDEHLLLTYLDRDFDTAEGVVEVFPRDYIMRVDDQTSVELERGVMPGFIDPDDPENMLVWVLVERGRPGSRLADNQKHLSMRLYRQSLDRNQRSMAYNGTEDFAYLLNANGEPVARVVGNDQYESIQDIRVREQDDSAEELEVWRRGENGGWVLLHEERFELDAEYHFAGRNWKDWTGVVEAIAGLDADGRYGYFSSITEGTSGTRREGRRRAIYRMDMQTGAIEGPVLESETADVGGLYLDYIRDWRNNAVIGVRWAEHRTLTHYFDPQFAALQTEIETFFPESNVDLVSWDREFSKVVITVHGGSTAGTHYLLEPATGTVSLLGLARPRLPDASISPVRIVEYTSRDGTDLFGYLTSPVGREISNLPLVVLPHGGPEARDYYDFDLWAQFLASRGYAVFQPQFRGSSGFGQDFAEAGYRRWGEEMQDDVSDSIGALATRGFIDPDRVCIFGWSYGGYAAMAGATLTPDLYRCAVAGAGVSDLNAMMIHERDDGYGSSQLYWARNIGDFRGRENRTALSGVSPANNVEHASIPLLLIHGTADLVVPHEQSEIMVEAMNAADRPVEFISIEGGPHSFSEMRVSDHIAILTNLERFLLEHNPPDEMLNQSAD